ncbi:MAG: ABC transporter permease [Erysipelotrichaceae bacterium]|nr:ABC transporter permease [Erysipelotrichaceae bacterium]MDY5251819.1 ABC transporter permease [Erysipelotrichaceae bacterium]
MHFEEILRMSIINMLENKFRLLLTSLGIVVGTVTIILVFAIGKGAEVEAAKQFSNLSADTVYVNLDHSSLALNQKIDEIEKLSPFLMEKIIEESTSLEGLYLRASNFQEMSYKNNSASGSVLGVTSDYLTISSLSLANGGDFNDEDHISGNRVAIIGYELARKLFGTDEAIGNYLKIKDERYRVVGILARSADGLQGMNVDNSLFIPYETMEKTELMDDYTTTQLVGKAKNIKLVEKAKQEIMSTLNYYMKDASAYKVEDAGTRIEAATASATTMSMLLISVALIVFIVGGIGIMNVMFVTVKERTKEIGILKALGTSNDDILKQFLLEAACIGLFSGVVGVLISFLALKIIVYFNVPIYPSWMGKIIACLFAIITSTIFGFYPAYKAAQLMPIEALNDE